ncbi:MAG TPA: beta-ketoacyl-[acyl-carrier-protein] synthase family protein [Verrucomicrobiae bacterium]
MRQWLQECPVVITGMGAVSAAGADVGALWEAAVRGKKSAKVLDFEEAKFAGCPVADGMLKPAKNPLLRKADRSAQLAVAAAQAAWVQAGCQTFPAERVAVLAGTSRGPVGKMLESAGRVRIDRVLPSSAASSTLASLSGLVALSVGAGGPTLTISAACASAAGAIALAAEQVLLEKVDVAVAGGAEAPLHPMVLAQLKAAGVLGEAGKAEEICRPFDLSRTGTVLGEGAGFLVIETEAGAKKRGASILARLSGWAVGAESGERTGISEDSAALVRAMQQALHIAGLTPQDIGYINAHGTGTILNDRQETVACRRVFGEHVPPCSSIKPVTGHCMGAAAALEAIVSIEALRRGILPPTPNWRTPDPECSIDIISGKARHSSVNHVMSNSSGFWGNNASLIFSKA